MMTMRSNLLLNGVSSLAGHIGRTCSGALETVREWSGSDRSSFGSAEHFESLTGSIGKLLFLSEASVAQCARQVLLHETLLRRWSARGRTAFRQGTGYPPQILPLSQAVTEIVSSSGKACILALPLSYTSVMLTAHLNYCQPNIQVIVLSTQLSRLYLTPRPGLDTMTLVGPSEMIQLARAANKERGRSTVYITFPDHQVTGSGTMWPVAFCRSEYLFSVLEPLILSCISGPLLTLDTRESNGSNGSLFVSECPKEVFGDGSQSRAKAILAWLAGRIEAVIKAFPGEILSWNSILHRSTRFEWWSLWCQLKAFEGAINECWRIDSSRNVSTYETARKTLSALETLLMRESSRRCLTAEASSYE